CNGSSSLSSGSSSLLVRRHLQLKRPPRNPPRSRQRSRTTRSCQSLPKCQPPRTRRRIRHPRLNSHPTSPLPGQQLQRHLLRPSLTRNRQRLPLNRGNQVSSNLMLYPRLQGARTVPKSLFNPLHVRRPQFLYLKTLCETPKIKRQRSRVCLGYTCHKSRCHPRILRHQIRTAAPKSPRS